MFVYLSTVDLTLAESDIWKLPVSLHTSINSTSCDIFLRRRGRKFCIFFWRSLSWATTIFSAIPKVVDLSKSQPEGVSNRIYEKDTVTF